MATNPKHQESGNISNHPNRAPAPPLIVQQQLQSMAAAMVDLMQQNLELEKSTDNVDNGTTKNIGRIQRMEGQRTVLKEEISPEVPSLRGCHTWREKCTK